MTYSPWIYKSQVVILYKDMARTSASQKLGNKIREHRLALGLSQEKLGELTGIDRTYISGVERGKRNPAVKNLERLAKALKVRVSDLIDF